MKYVFKFYFFTHCSNIITACEHDQKFTYWRQYPGLRQPQRIIGFSTKKAKKLTILNRKEGDKSGKWACSLRFPNEHMGKDEHWLIDYGLLVYKGLLYLDSEFPTATNIKEITPKMITGFLRSLDLGWVNYE